MSAVPIRRDEQMARRVRELVQQHERALAAVDDEVLDVVALGGAAEDAAVLLVRRLDVFEPPRRPQALHRPRLRVPAQRDREQQRSTAPRSQAPSPRRADRSRGRCGNRPSAPRLRASRQTKKSVTGSSAPFTTCTSTSSLITGTPGIIATTAPIAMRTVMTPTKTGASRGRRAMPFSNPNVSAMTYAAVTGKIAAASRLAPSRPTANSASAKRPANGSSARAASAAL